MSFNGSTLARQLDRLEQDRRLQGISRRTARLVPKNRKAGRLGNDRPSLGARLGVGIEALGCVWEGGPDEAAWGAACGLSEFPSKSGNKNATDCSTSRTNERLQVNRP